MAFVRIVLLASGSGTLTQAVIDAFTGPGSADVEIVAIGSDSPTAGVLARASRILAASHACRVVLIIGVGSPIERAGLAAPAGPAPGHR